MHIKQCFYNNLFSFFILILKNELFLCSQFFKSLTPVQSFITSSLYSPLDPIVWTQHDIREHYDCISTIISPFCTHVTAPESDVFAQLSLIPVPLRLWVLWPLFGRLWLCAAPLLSPSWDVEGRTQPNPAVWPQVWLYARHSRSST